MMGTSRHVTNHTVHTRPEEGGSQPMSRKTISVNYTMLQLDGGNICQVISAISTVRLHTGYRRTTDELLLLLAGKFL